MCDPRRCDARSQRCANLIHLRESIFCEMDFDGALIGGGPAGSTAGALLKKYSPELKVLILEREKFPRDHVGESQLPPISLILDEMGAWDKIEAANFPIKVGATYRWGKTPELWDFEFFPSEQFVDEPRPAKFEGQRRFTAFQVDRAIYDDILLKHAASLGCEVREETKVAKIHRSGDTIQSLELENGESVTAKHYVDASGHSGIIRRAMGVQAEFPSSLQNVAFWDYYQNADWAVKIGVGGTKVQVMSLSYGWIWFIPLGPTRTSVGLIVPAEYFKKSGKEPKELFLKAVGEDDRIASLLGNAESEGLFQTTKDWSFLASRQAGDNWFLIGEAAGFADPILAAGMTMAHFAGREVAFTILELERGGLPADWLKSQFESRQSRRIGNHIRFADYWYTANAQFEDLKDFTSVIAKDAGLDLQPDKAWQWLAQGGFIDEGLAIGTGGYSLETVRGLGRFLNDVPTESPLEQNNIYKLNLDGATWRDRAHYRDGRVIKDPCYVRGERVLPLRGAFDLLVGILQKSQRLPDIMDALNAVAVKRANDPKYAADVLSQVIPAMEAMVTDGWVTASLDPN